MLFHLLNSEVIEIRSLARTVCMVTRKLITLCKNCGRTVTFTLHDAPEPGSVTVTVALPVFLPVRIT